MKKTIIIVRHAEYVNDPKNPRDASLSEKGMEQSKHLAFGLSELIDLKSQIVIWSSPANRAMETACILKNKLEIQTEIVSKDLLWADKWHKHDFDWLRKEIENSEDETIIIVSHLEYVQDFPALIGGVSNEAEYTQGIIIFADGTNKLIN